MPLITFVVFSSFIVYATWAAFQGEHYHYGPYLSPFYSPELFGDSPHALVRPEAGWWPAVRAVLAGAADPGRSRGGFRFTCYYYRGAYYKAFWADPPSCAVGEPRKSYRGERTFPLHHPERPPLLPVPRAASSSCILAYDVVEGAVVRRAPTARTQFGIGVGTLVLAVNVDAARRLHASAATRSATWSAACMDVLSRPPGAQDALRLRRAASIARHMLWAWISLFSVGFADLYVRLCAMGVWHDWRIL